MKYLLGKGLKNYKIPLPLVLNKKIGKHHAGENDKTHLCERHFPNAIPKGEGKKRERPSRCCFICTGREWLIRSHSLASGLLPLIPIVSKS